MDKYQIRFTCPTTYCDRCGNFEGKGAKERALSCAEIISKRLNVTVNVVCIKEEFVSAFLKKDTN